MLSEGGRYFLTRRGAPPPPPTRSDRRPRAYPEQGVAEGPTPLQRARSVYQCSWGPPPLASLARSRSLQAAGAVLARIQNRPSPEGPPPLLNALGALISAR